MPSNNQDDLDKPDKTTGVSAKKVGVVGDNATIENQNLSTVINNYHYHKDPEAHSASDSAEPENIPNNPYKGLAHFGPDDAGLFFGRDDIIDKLTSTISNKQFTAVIGPSGSGKSSVVLAGVAPRLFKQDQWLFSYFRISDSSVNNPFMAMSQALIPYFNPALEGVEQLREAKKLAQCLEDSELSLFDVCDKIRQNTPQKRLLLIADQFEELFTTGVPAETQQKFITLLVNTFNNQKAHDKHSVLSMVITLRADFLEQAAADAALASLINSSPFIIGPMEKKQLRQAIEEPAKLRGVRFEAGLVDTILDDVGEAHGNLPLAEFALRLLWEKQHNKLISAEAYHAIGRVKGALSLHAQDIYKSLNAKEQSTAQRIFTQLVKIGSGTEDTRRIALRTDFSEQDWSLLQRFADEKHRLIVTNKVDDIDTAEVVHEALIRHWPLLRKWVNEKRLFLTWLDEVRRAMEQWQNYDESADSLLRGVALGQAHEWLSDQPENIPSNVQTFIRQSERQQQKKILKAKRKNLALGVVSFVTIIVVAVLAWYQFEAKLEAQVLKDIAENQTLNAQKQTQQAEYERDKQLETQSRFLAELSRQNTEKGNVRVGVLLALEALPDYSKKVAFRRPYISEAEYSLHLNLGKMLDTRWLQHNDKVNTATFSLDGARIVTASRDNTARVWDSANGNLQRSLEGHADVVNHAAFSPDGVRIVTASFDKTARVWDSTSGNLLFTLEGHTDAVFHAVFSPDGARILTDSWDNTARVWDSTSGNLLHTLEGHTSSVHPAAFSPDGARIVTASFDKTARVWDSTSGNLLRTLAGHADVIYQAAFSPDGARVVTASHDKTARVWNSASGNLLRTLDGHTGIVYYAAFSPDGARIVTASHDKTARVWSSASGNLLHTLEGHADAVYYAAFSPGGARILTASRDSAARVWNSTDGTLLGALESHDNTVLHADFSPDSARIVTVSSDGTARVWERSRSNLLHTLEGHTGTVRHAAFSPDGARIVTASDDKTARVWDSASDSLLHSLEGHTEWVYHATFSPDGARILTASKDSTARVWDSVSGNLLHTLEGHTDTVRHAAFSPDGARIVTASYDKTARVWDSTNGTLVHNLEGHTEWVYHAAFSPDGARIVTASYDKTARVWDSTSGTLVHNLEGHTEWVYHAAFSPDGARIVTTSYDKTARVWDSASGNLLYSLEGHDGLVYHAAFSPDGARIVTASRDSAARVWDSANGSLLHSLEGHTNTVNHAAFSPDGSRIVTASFDNTARVWDSASGTLVHTLEGHDEWVYHAAFSPDGARILTTSKDNTARVWKNYSTEELTNEFKKLNLPPLTEKVRSDNFLD